MNGRIGERVKRRSWVCSRVLPQANHPLLRVIDHAYQLTEHMFVSVIDCLEIGMTDVPVTKRKLDVHLRLRGLAFSIA